MSLLPDKFRLVIWKSATFRQRVLIYEDDGTTIRDLTGYTGDCIIKDATGATLLELTTENGGIIMGGSTGILEIYIDATDTSLISWKSAIYGLNIQGGPDADVDPILYGTVVVRHA